MKTCWYQRLEESGREMSKTCKASGQWMATLQLDDVIIHQKYTRSPVRHNKHMFSSILVESEI